VLTAAALIVLIATRARIRWIYLGGLVLLIAIQQVITHGMIQPDDIAKLDPVNKVFFWVFSVWIFGCAALQMFVTGRAQGEGAFAKLIGYATILVWVTGAAAGRWIAFA